MLGQKQRTFSAIAFAFLSAIANSVQGLGHGPEDSVKGPNPHWGIIYRNTIGSPNIGLTFGPFVEYSSNGTAVRSSPPFGRGSLFFLVGAISGNVEKAAFGNEVDYLGELLDTITQLGYYVFTTGEDATRNAANLPNIAFEVIISGSQYSSLVWDPPAVSTTNRWSDYMDATTTGTWYWTHPVTGLSCNQSNPCTFTAIKSEASSLDPNLYITSVAISKGRDYEWQGAIDGLRINNRTMDFEFDGVLEHMDKPTRP